jgi:hypothetical protein
MSKSLKSGILLYPVLFSLIALSTLLLSGCGDRPGGGEPPINEDTVKAHVIPIQLAAAYTKDFRANIDTFNQKCPGFKEQMNFGKAEAFPSDLYRLLLKQKDSTGTIAAGIRIYYGRGSDGLIRLVLVPYDKNGNDIINKLVSVDAKQLPGVSPEAKTATTTSSDGQAGEQGQHCPAVCSDASSPLNP